LAQRILHGPRIEGVTFAGGEPFNQAGPLAELGHLIQSRNLSVICFTGFLKEDIIAAGREDWRDLLAVTDLLIDGPYQKEAAELARPWVGSRNQRYHFLTDRYRYLEQDLKKMKNRMEIRISADGIILANGMGDLKMASSLLCTNQSHRDWIR